MKIENIWFDDVNMYVKLNTGHIIGNPIAWFTRLKTASPEERLKFEIDTYGESIHWENLDEDLSLESLFDFKHELNYAKL